MKRALVIKYGNADMANSMADVLMAETDVRVAQEDTESVRAELEREKAENGVRKVRDTKTFKRKMLRSRRKYHVRKLTRPEEILLIGWAITCLTVQECFRRLAAWNREA